MKRELLTPLVYSVSREVYRFNLDPLSAFVRAVSATLRSFLWVAVCALIATGAIADPSTLARLAVSVVAFMITYEIGYVITDNLGIRLESKETRLTVYPEIVPIRLVIAAVAIRLALLFVLFGAFRPWFPDEIITAHLLTLILFTLHCVAPAVIRIVTFFGLRLLKASVPCMFLLQRLPPADLVWISAGIIGSALYFVPHYASKKLNRQLHFTFDFFTWRNSSLVIPISLSVLVALSRFFEVRPSGFFLLSLALLLNQLVFGFMSFVRRSMFRLRERL